MAIYYVDNLVADTHVASATPDFTTYNPVTFTTGVDGTASVFKTIADINAFAALAAGDSVLFRRGQTWAEQLTIPASGLAGSVITFGAFGSGNAPAINGGVVSIDTNAKNYITIKQLKLAKMLSINAGQNITANYCLIGPSSPNRGILAASSPNTVVNNCTIYGEVDSGIRATGATETITIRNCMIVGNGYSSGGGIFNDGNATVNYDYCLITGNGLRPNSNVSITGVGKKIDGGHNKEEYFPSLTSYKYDNPGTNYHCITIDDYDVSYVESIVALFPSGSKMTFFVTVAHPLFPTWTVGDKARLVALSNAGHEISCHTWSHSDLTKTNAIAVTSTNTNPTCDVDVATTILTLSCDEGGNIVSFNWSGGKTITDLKAAVVGKGWTIATQTGITDTLKIDSLADTAGPHAVPYTCTLDVSAPNYAYWHNEIVDALDWLQVVLGARPTTMAYPGGYSNAALVNYVKNIAGLLGARGVSGSLTFPSIAIYTVGASMLNTATLIGDGSQAWLESVARHKVVAARCEGVSECHYDHSAAEISALQISYIVNELNKWGARTYTFAEIINAIRGDHSTSDGLTYTKTYTDAFDGHLQSSSLTINAGVDVGLTQDYEGNAVPYGAFPDIGAYEWQGGIGGGGGLPAFLRRRRR
jgi:hypothetical protein